jgi:hypothetical protein
MPSPTTLDVVKQIAPVFATFAAAEDKATYSPLKSRRGVILALVTMLHAGVGEITCTCAMGTSASLPTLFRSDKWRLPE